MMRRRWFKRLDYPRKLTVGPRFVEKRFREWPMAADGLTDDSEALRIRIAAALLADGVVRIPNGVIMLESPIVVPDGIHDTNFGTIVTGTVADYRPLRLDPPPT